MFNNLDYASIKKIQTRDTIVETPTTCESCMYGRRYPGYCENMGGICGCGKLVGTQMIKEKK